jgi:hypothetical protein
VWGGENMSVATQEKDLNLIEQIEEKLKGADEKQISFFVWICSVRVLPFLVTNGGFDFWGDDRINHLHNVFNAVDITYAFNKFKPEVVCDYLKIKESDPNNNSRSINAIGHAVAPAAYYAHRQSADLAHHVVHVVENAVFASYFSIQDLSNETIKVAFKFRKSETLKYISSVIEKTNIKLKEVVLKDIERIMAGEYGDFDKDTSIYNGAWENFQDALSVEGCDYWGSLYEDIFRNNFQVDEEALKRRLNEFIGRAEKPRHKNNVLSKIGNNISFIVIIAFSVLYSFRSNEFTESGGFLAMLILFLPTMIGTWEQTGVNIFKPFVSIKYALIPFVIAFGLFSIFPTVWGSFHVLRTLGAEYYDSGSFHIVFNEYIPIMLAFLSVSALLILVFSQKENLRLIPAQNRGIAQTVIIAVSVALTVETRILFLGLNGRQLSLNLPNQIVATALSILATYLGLYCLLCVICMRIKLGKHGKWKLCGLYQILPWIALLSPLTFVYTLNMHIEVNIAAVAIIAVMMFFVTWSRTFEYDNKIVRWIGFTSISVLCFLAIIFLANEDFRFRLAFMGVLFISLSAVITFNLRGSADCEFQRVITSKIKFRDAFRSRKLKIALAVFIAVLIAVPIIPTEHPKREYLSNFTDVTEQFVGATITIQSIAENTSSYGRYLSANDSDSLARFNRTIAGEGEQFAVIASERYNGYINLRAGSNGNFVRTQHNRQHGPLIADAAIPYGWEAFRILELDGNHYLITQTNSIFIMASEDKAHIPAEARYPVGPPSAFSMLKITIVSSENE